MPQTSQELSRDLETHRAAIRLHCYRMTGSLHDAEDLTQEVLVRAWEGTFGESSVFKGPGLLPLFGLPGSFSTPEAP